MIDKELFHLPKAKTIIVRLAILSVLQAFFIASQGVSLAVVLTHLWEKKAFESQMPYLLYFLLSFFIRHLLTLIKDRILENYAQEQSSRLRSSLLQKIFEKNTTFVENEGSGTVTTLVLDGIAEAEVYIQLIFSKLFNMAIVPFVLFFVIFYFDKLSAIELFVVFPIVVLFMIVLGKAAKEKANQQYGNFEKLSNHFLDSLRGLKTLKVFGQSKNYANSVYRTSETFRKSTMSTLRVAILSTFALDFFTTLSVAVVATFLGLRLIAQEITLLPALAILILSPEYFLPLREFAGDYHATLNGKNAFSKILRAIQDDRVEVDKKEFHGKFGSNSRFSVQQLGVELQEKVVLDGIDFTVEGFEKIGIIGKSGAGKSTLIRVLAGLLDTSSGVIDFQGEKFHSLRHSSWQENLFYLPQNPYLFSGTLRENILFYSPKSSDEELRQAVSFSGLSELVEELPKGLDTMVGVGGRKLSGGQEQRIAIARTILDNRRNVLLFDEPTAHLDIETEVEIKEKLITVMENKLVFFATHRLHWMKEMDKVLVIDKGKVVGFDSHENLLRENETYQKIVKELRGSI